MYKNKIQDKVGTAFAIDMHTMHNCIQWGILYTKVWLKIDKVLREVYPPTINLDVKYFYVQK